MNTPPQHTVKKLFLCLLTAIFLLANLYFILLILKDVSSVVWAIINISETLDDYITTDAMITPLVILPVSEVLAAVFIVLLYRKNMPLYSRIAAYAAAPVQFLAMRGLWAVQEYADSKLPAGSVSWNTTGYKAFALFCAIIYTAVSVLIIIGTIKTIMNLSEKPIDNPANA